MTRTVLLVDDDELFTDVLKMCLPDKSKQWQIMTASNGLEALELLEKNQIDVVVTDINMPVMNGIELIAELKIAQKTVPVIVMTTVPVAGLTLPKDSALTILQKPVAVETLQNELGRVFAASPRPAKQTIPLTAFLQLLHHERKKVTVGLERGVEVGFLHILDGQLFDAECGSLSGLAAAHTMLGWSDARINLLPLTPNRPITIQDKLEFVLLEFARVSDEAKLARKQPASETDFSQVSFSSSIVMASDSRSVATQPAINESRWSPSPPVVAAVSPSAPRPPIVPHQIAAIAPRGLPLKYANLVNTLSNPQLKAAHAIAKPSGEVAHSHNMPKASTERAQYLIHLASLMGRELGLQRVFEARVIGRNSALWIKEGARFSVVTESAANFDLDELSAALAGEI